MKPAGLFYADQTEADALLIEAAIQSGQFAAAILVEFDFLSGPVRLCNRTVPIIDGLGNLHGPAPQMSSWRDVSAGSENLAPLRIYELTVPLEVLQQFGGDAGPFPDLSDKTSYQGRDASMKLQILSVAQGVSGEDVAIGKPVFLHKGFMDKLTVGITREGVKHELRVESLLSRKAVRGSGLFTPRDQKRRHPGDLGADYAGEAASTTVAWPTN